MAMSTTSRWLLRIGALFLGVLIETTARIVDKFAGASALTMTLRGAVILGLIAWAWSATQIRRSASNTIDPNESISDTPIGALPPAPVSPTATTSVEKSAPATLVVDEDAIYASIGKELETGSTDKGLWTRLFAECDGDENRTKVAYIKQRAEKLKMIEQERLSDMRETDAVLEIIKRLRRNGYEVWQNRDGWQILDPLGGRLTIKSNTALGKYAEGLLISTSD